MNPNWAEENLQTIRTLMERSALYRRALAPIMTFVGILGLFAALTGWYFKIMSPAIFIAYWFIIAAVAVIGSFLMARRQALREAEPFWSPPTKRIAQAIFPPLLAGFVLGLLVIAVDCSSTESDPPTGEWPISWIFVTLLPPLWIILYGCAVHAAGFFISRGMRFFGLFLVFLGCCSFLFANNHSGRALVNSAYTAMGGVFGFLHLAYAIYLAATEKGKKAA